MELKMWYNRTILKGEIRFRVVGEIRKGDSLTFTKRTVHKTKKGEDSHYTSWDGLDFKPNEFLTITILDS